MEEGDRLGEVEVVEVRHRVGEAVEVVVWEGVGGGLPVVVMQVVGERVEEREGEGEWEMEGEGEGELLKEGGSVRVGVFSDDRDPKGEVLAQMVGEREAV